jgi:hypothetical protein
MPGLDDLLKFPVLSPLYAIPIILVGLALAFFGKAVFKWLIILAGGIVGGTALALVAQAYGQSELVVLGATIIGFIIGGLLGIFLVYVSVFLIGAYIGYLLVLTFTSNIIAVAIVAIIFGILAIIIFKFALPILTAIVGGSMVGQGLMLAGVIYPVAAVIGIAVIILGAIYQLLTLR